MSCVSSRLTSTLAFMLDARISNLTLRTIADSADNIDLIENISLLGEIVRLNLQPYKFRNGDVDQLFQAMIKSVRNISGQQKEFVKLWNEFKRAVLDGKLDFDLDELTLFDAKVKSQNYPAMHHSEGYRIANNPAYRVLTKNDALKLIENQFVSLLKN